MQVLVQTIYLYIFTNGCNYSTIMFLYTILCGVNCMPVSVFESYTRLCVYEYVHMLLMPPADALFMYFILK